MMPTNIIWTLDAYHTVLKGNGIDCDIKDVPKHAPDNWLTTIDADNDDGHAIVKVNECIVEDK